MIVFTVQIIARDNFNDTVTVYKFLKPETAALQIIKLSLLNGRCLVAWHDQIDKFG